MSDISYRIRPVSAADLDAVTQVEAACFPAAEAATRESFQSRIAAFPESFFVAELAEEENASPRLIGLITGCVTDERTIRDEMFEDTSLHNPQGRYQSIFSLAVHPDFQHKGIAAALMNHLIGDAKEKGRSGLILTCKDRLIHFYESFGYKNMGVSASVHGGAVWYDMILEFGEA